MHGIPGPRRLREGQLVKLDVTAELDGFYADACRTVPVGRVRGREQRLAAAAQSALRRGLEAATAGANVGAIGAAVQPEVERRGFSVCAELTGHGIGRRIHEEPDVPNIAWDGPELTNGLVITVEPIIAAGGGDVHVADDGWTIRTDDGSPSAHAEHTIVITESRADPGDRMKAPGRIGLGCMGMTWAYDADSATTRSRSRSSTARSTSA